MYGNDFTQISKNLAKDVKIILFQNNYVGCSN